MIEKYLNDTLQKKSVADVERISKTNLMPAYFKRLQYKTDSLRAIEWFQKTKDSTYLERYSMTEAKSTSPMKNEKPSSGNKRKYDVAILPNDKFFRSRWEVKLV